MRSTTPSGHVATWAVARPTASFSPSRRTASPLGSDCESEAYGLPATINTQGCSPITLGYFPVTLGYFPITVPYSSITVSYSRHKKFLRFYPPFLPFSLGTPLFTGVHGREGKQMSLPSPSRLGSLVFKMGGSELKKGRVTGGTFVFPPVPQTPCTSAFERG